MYVLSLLFVVVCCSCLLVSVGWCRVCSYCVLLFIDCSLFVCNVCCCLLLFVCCRVFSFVVVVCRRAMLLVLLLFLCVVL